MAVVHGYISLASLAAVVYIAVGMATGAKCGLFEFRKMRVPRYAVPLLVASLAMAGGVLAIIFGFRHLGILAGRGIRWFRQPVGGPPLA